MHRWNCKWAMLSHKPLLSETTSDKNMNLDYWLMWLSLLLLTVCSLPVALGKVFALNCVSPHNNPERCCRALYLSLSVLAHLHIQNQCLIFSQQSSQSYLTDISINIWLPFPHTIISNVFFFLQSFLLPQTQTPTCHIHTHTQSFSNLAFAASHTGICKRACVVHSSSLVHTGRGWQTQRP